ncbi:MAG TPA: hypothetical protein VFH66_15430 [Mycobacteriales bacterium]|nr:hypothetical protein [Mycobacteriales bacterium]
MDFLDWISGLIDAVIFFVRGFYWSVFFIAAALLFGMYVAAH